MNTSLKTNEDGLIHVNSSHDMATSSERLINILTDKGMTIFAQINHSTGAAKIGESLNPTELVLFGNPQTGTPLMQNNQTAGIDLPQKILIWKDSNDQVWLTYNDPAYLANRHQLDNCNALLEKISGALAGMTNAAAK